MQVSKNQIKYIRSLSQQKFRKEHKAYVVEGVKSAEEWLQARVELEYIVGLEKWLQENVHLYSHLPKEKIAIATEEDLEKMSGLKTANEVLLVASLPDPKPFAAHAGKWILVLEKIQDPGNMGTIIRTADWFGIRQIVVSPDCVEAYNPKVVQACMGGLLRVNIIEEEVTHFLKKHDNIPSYGACLQGRAIKELSKIQPGFIVMGNESKGLSAATLQEVTHKITIPRIGHAESLNVAVAAGIVCYGLMM